VISPFCHVVIHCTEYVQLLSNHSILYFIIVDAPFNSFLKNCIFSAYISFTYAVRFLMT
jgi:hypothetical protein